MTTEQLIEAILFSQPEPMAIKRLARLVKLSSNEIEISLAKLTENLVERGIVLIKTAEEVSLATHPEASSILKEIRQEELQKNLGQAGLETLSAVIYAGPLTKGRIDYLRGVNSGFILRHLLVRGLIERTSNPTDNRSYLYRPTIELLSYLGVSRIEDLPDYEKIQAELNSQAEEESKHENAPIE